MITARANVRTPGRVAAVAVLVLTLVSGCGFTKSPMCSLVGAIPGVTFEVPAALVPDAAASYRLRACTDESCVESDTHGGEPTMSTVALPPGDWPGAATARLTITRIDPGSSVGEVVFDARTSVDVTLYEPNGSGCEPHVFAGSVRGTTDGRLEAIARHA